MELIKIYIFLSLILITSLVANPILAQPRRLGTPTMAPRPTIAPTIEGQSRPAVEAGPRFAACDLCGYCPPNPPPQSWSSCQKCLYPDINPDPAGQESLAVDPETNSLIAGAPGRMYTFLGCITTGSGGFTEEGGAGGVIQSLLRVIFSTVGGIAFLYLLYGSFIVATSQNDPEKINYGKRVISGAIIGLIFSLSSVFIINLIANQVLKIPGFGEVPTH